jgi:hypothetical protein
MEGDKEDLIINGMNYFIGKPITTAQLINLLNKWFK